MPKGWWTVEIPWDAPEREELAAILAETFEVGVHMEDGLIRLYLPAERPLSDWRRPLESLLERFRESFGGPPADSVRYGMCEDTDWNARWKEGFKPLRIGRRLVVVPTWESFTPREGDLMLTLDPGMAFGTGHHETTRLCIRWLEKVIEEWKDPVPPSLLDVGTGSGILALAGALFGFQPVVGVDNDPEAVQVARENRLLNPKTASVQFLAGTVEAVSGRFSRVVANIQAGPLLAMAEAVAAKTAPGGRLGLCGLLAEQVEAVISRYTALGFHANGQLRDGQWVLVSLQACR